MIGSIPTSNKGGGRGAAREKTEVGPRAGRASRPRHSVIPGHGADRFLPRGRSPPIQIRPPRVRQTQYRPKCLVVAAWPHFHPKAVRNMRGAFLPHFPCCRCGCASRIRLKVLGKTEACIVRKAIPDTKSLEGQKP